MAADSPTENQTMSQLDLSEKAPQAPSDVPVPGFGWNRYAEKLNGRFAMIGFVALLLTEWFAQQDFFSWIGLR